MGLFSRFGKNKKAQTGQRETPSLATSRSVPSRGEGPVRPAQSPVQNLEDFLRVSQGAAPSHQAEGLPPSIFAAALLADASLCQVLSGDRNEFLDAEPILRVSPSASAEYRKSGLSPSVFAAALLAVEHGKATPEILKKHADGSYRLDPAARLRIASLFVYSDKTGEVIVTGGQPQHPSYKPEGKVNIPAYGENLCRVLGVNRSEFLEPSIQKVPGPSRFCRCPHCQAVVGLEGLSEGRRATRLANYERNPEGQESPSAHVAKVIVSCSTCKGALDVSDSRYDLPEVKLHCPHCKTSHYGPAEELLGNPCPACRAPLPGD